MRRHGPPHLRRFVLAALCSAGLACTSSPPAGAPQPLVLLTGPPSGAYLPLGAALAQVYNTSIPGVHVTATPADGPGGAASNSQAVVAGKVDLAFSRSDLAYQVYRGVATDGAPSGEKLRSLAVVYTNAVHILVRRGSGIVRGATCCCWARRTGTSHSRTRCGTISCSRRWATPASGRRRWCCG